LIADSQGDNTSSNLVGDAKFANQFAESKIKKHDTPIFHRL